MPVHNEKSNAIPPAKILIQNGPVVTPTRVIPLGGVLIEDGKILEVLEKPMQEPPAHTNVIDAAGQTISPGFVDLHVHGGGGLEIMNASPEDINAICLAHSRYGTTAMLPTTLAAPIDDICHTIDNIRTASENTTGADIIGVHLEGPYFAMAQRGAQAPEYIINPSEDNINRLLDRWSGIRMMGAAPEIPGGFELGAELVKRGIVASIAHSDATFEDIEKAISYGYTDITHIYSGCSHVHRVKAYRVAGVVEAGLYFDDLTAQVIADGKHLPPSLLRLIYKCKGPDKISLITDGLGPSAADIPEGTVYTQPNGMQTVLDDGVMKVLDFQSFAGSCATMSRLVRNMIELAGASLVDAVRMASLTPATVIGAAKRGCLAPGFNADVILFDEKINVSMVMVGGKIL